MALNSWPFFALAACAILMVPELTGWRRLAAVLAMNAVFAWSYWGRLVPVAFAYILAGFLCARAVRGRGHTVLVASLTMLTAVFLYLRGYTLQAWTGGEARPSALLAFAGLSFLFFKMVHVVVDASSGSLPRVTFGTYLNHCLNFTTLLMGPIQRYQDYAAQEDAPLGGSLEDYVDAVNRVLLGLLKAFVAAPLLAPEVLRHGMAIGSMGALELLLRTYGFYVFLYLDFSGYCDIVIGIARLMGLRLPENFDFPFLSRNVAEYWQRVHRSLTAWLTDYVFTPLYHALLRTHVGRERAFAVLAASLVVTMAVAGLWHGTTPNFAAFGLIHGLALVAMRAYEHVMTRRLGRARFRQLSERRTVRALSTALTYNFTSIAYVFFVLDLGESLRLFTRLGSAFAGYAS